MDTEFTRVNINVRNISVFSLFCSFQQLLRESCCNFYKVTMFKNRSECTCTLAKHVNHCHTILLSQSAFLSRLSASVSFPHVLRGTVCKRSACVNNAVVFLHVCFGADQQHGSDTTSARGGQHVSAMPSSCLCLLSTLLLSRVTREGGILLMLW